jgi:hypothetical protein
MRVDETQRNLENCAVFVWGMLTGAGIHWISKLNLSIARFVYHLLERWSLVPAGTTELWKDVIFIPLSVLAAYKMGEVLLDMNIRLLLGRDTFNAMIWNRNAPKDVQKDIYLYPNTKFIPKVGKEEMIEDAHVIGGYLLGFALALYVTEY